VKPILLTMWFALSAVSGAWAADLKPYTGEPLPDFILRDLQGQKHQLSNFKGKVVMVNFWATYCTPCVKEMPSIQRLNSRLKDTQFQILAIDVAEDRAAIEAFLKRFKIAITFPILIDTEGNVVEAWGVGTVPTTFIIDPQGTLRYVHYGALEWDSNQVVKTITSLLHK